MSSLGNVSAILAYIGFILVSSAITAIFVAVCFYGFWYAVKNSPTLRTRRFVIQAAIDFNLLIWAVYGFAQIWFFSMGFFYDGRLPKLWIAIFDDWHHDFSGLCFYLLPMLVVFSFFVLYVLLRWRTILYEDLGGITVPKIDVKSGEFREMFAKTFENECRWIANLMKGIHRLQNYFLTAAGLRTKRNVAVWIIAAFLTGYAVLLILMNLNTPHNVTTPALRPLFYSLIIWGILVDIIIQAFFFWIVSVGMKISEDETALERTPPKFGTEHWSLEELAPQNRRRILCSAVVLLAAIPLCTLFQAEIWNIVREIRIYFGAIEPSVLELHFDFDVMIQVETVLVALAVLWGSRYPHRRFLGYAILFLVSGLWAAVLNAEGLTFSLIVLQPLCKFCFSRLGAESQNQLFQDFTMSELYFYHCFALTQFIYSLLAAAICYGIHRRTIKYVAPLPVNGDSQI